MLLQVLVMITSYDRLAVIFIFFFVGFYKITHHSVMVLHLVLYVVFLSAVPFKREDRF